MGESIRSAQSFGSVAVDRQLRPMLLRRLMVRCPVTGISADTGLDLSSVPKLVSSEQLLVDCPECGQDHTWIADDAFVE